MFTRNASEAINLVANTWGTEYIKAGDEIILSVLEHHSNIVPWQLLAGAQGACSSSSTSPRIRKSWTWISFDRW